MVRWALLSSADLGRREIGGVVHGRHTITLFRRPRTVHLEAGDVARLSSRPSVGGGGGRARLMARLSTVDGRPMELDVDQLAVHDRSFRSLARSQD